MKFIVAALFVIATTNKQPRCPLNKENVVYIQKEI